MPVFNKTSTNCSSARAVSAGVSALALSAALLADVPLAVAADFHFDASGNVAWGQAPNSGFEGLTPPGIGDRAIYDRAGTGQSVVWGSGVKNAGQLVFLAPYTGSGF